ALHRRRRGAPRGPAAFETARTGGHAGYGRGAASPGRRGGNGRAEPRADGRGRLGGGGIGGTAPAADVERGKDGGDGRRPVGPGPSATTRSPQRPLHGRGRCRRRAA